jgi:hypothetical protein
MAYHEHILLYNRIPWEEWIAWKDEWGCSLFESAIRNSDERIVRIFLTTQKCSIPEENSITFAMTSSNIVKLLLACGCYENIERTDNNCWYANQLIQIYIMNGFVLNFTKESKSTPWCILQYTLARQMYLACKTNIIALLALKKRRIHSMVHLDRFLIRDLAVEMYTDRYRYPLSRGLENIPLHDVRYGIFDGENIKKLCIILFWIIVIWVDIVNIANFLERYL